MVSAYPSFVHVCNRRSYRLNTNVDVIHVYTCTYMYFFALRDTDGEWYTYSFGGYHADDDERTVLEADNSGGPFFKSTPIDVHRFEMGKTTG